MTQNQQYTPNPEAPETITGAEALIRSLIAEGVDTVFGYPGGAILPVYDRLYSHTDDLRHILVRHEQGATHAAQGYARVSGKTGVVIVTSGPGATNVITGLADAIMDSTPLVVITGQVGASFLGSDAFQETDVVGITQPVTKWALQVRNAKDIPAAVARAFYIASNGRPGPVVLDIAKDAQLGLVEWEYKKLHYLRSYDPSPSVNPSDIVKAAEMLNNAQRPLILAGHGIMISGAEQQLVELAERADIPVATTLLGLSTIPSGHRLNKGMLGMHGNIGPNYNTNRADVILAVGMRFDDRVTGDTSKYAPKARIIHIDIDPSEFNRNVKVHHTIHADAKAALDLLIPMVEPARHDKWNAEIDACNKVEKDVVVSRELNPGTPRLTMGEVVSAVAAQSADNAVLVTDVGQNQMFSARYFTYKSPRSIISSGGLGTMGFGLPASIGAKIAEPDRQVFYFSGDGGFQMTIQELGTIMQYQVPVKMIVLNNNFLGNVRQWQGLFYNSRFSQTPMVNPDFCRIASAYGIKGEDVTTREQLHEAVKRMVESPEPYLLNVLIDETDMVFPMIPPGGAVDAILLDSKTNFTIDF